MSAVMVEVLVSLVFGSAIVVEVVVVEWTSPLAASASPFDNAGGVVFSNC